MKDGSGLKQDQHWQTNHCQRSISDKRLDYFSPKMSGECPTTCSLEIKQVSSETAGVQEESAKPLSWIAELVVAGQRTLEVDICVIETGRKTAWQKHPLLAET